MLTTRIYILWDERKAFYEIIFKKVVAYFWFDEKQVGGNKLFENWNRSRGMAITMGADVVRDSFNLVLWSRFLLFFWFVVELTKGPEVYKKVT